MPLTTTKLNVAYSLDSIPKKFVFTDVTDYQIQGVNLTTVTGKIEITYPSGDSYTGGSPDINNAIKRINTTDIRIPLLANGTPEVGNYYFKYTATSGAETAIYTVVFNFQYVSPKGVLTPTVDCLSPELKSTDATNYLSGSTTPSNQFLLIGASSSANTFTISGEKSGLFSVNDTFNVINSSPSANNGNYSVTSVSIDTSGNTVIGVSSVSNNSTSGGSISTKTNTIYYPPSLALSPVVGYNLEVSTSTFYSQTQSFKVITKSFYDFGNGISVIDKITGSSELDVDCDVRLCEVFCCINSTLKSYLAYRGVNDVLADRELNKYILATSHLSALRQAFECGYDKEVNSIVNEIITVTQCTPDCSCSDSSPQPITGLGSSSTTIVNSSGNGIEVGSNISGSTTTYSLSLSQSTSDKINAVAQTSTVSSEASSGLSVLPTTTGNNTNYLLALEPQPLVSPKEFMSFVLKKDGDVFTISDDVYQVKSNLKKPTFYFDASSLSNYPLEYFIKSFQVTENATYKMDINCYFQEKLFPQGTTLNSSQIVNYTPYVLDPFINNKASSSFSFIMRNINGNFLTRQTLASYSKLYFNIKIYE